MSKASDDFSDSNSISILLIEDSEDDYKITLSILEDVYGIDGFKLTWLQSPTDTIEILRSGAFEVVLCDNFLGSITGIELIQHIHTAMPMCPPIILLTGADDKTIDLKASSVGACDYLVKQSLDASELERSIRFATKRKIFERELLQVAHYDHLTGVANRKLFEITLADRLTQARRLGKKLGLILLDLDRFKLVNDTYGHPTGDKLLREVGDRISGLIRQSDFVARLGGDEFCIIAPNIEEARHLTPLVSKIVSRLSQPYSINGIEVEIGASAGIAVYPLDSKISEGLIEVADEALYRAKQKQSSSYHFCNLELNDVPIMNASIRRTAAVWSST